MKKGIFLIICILLASAPAVFAQDTDADGLEDSVETTYGTDPGDPDTDNDGLNDGSEDSNHNGVKDLIETNALDADTDDDGIGDGEELLTYSLYPLDSDSDNDNLNDGLEIGRSTPVSGGTSDNLGIVYYGTSGSWTGDSDWTTKTDPLDADSDNDIIPDGDEDKDHDGALDAFETKPYDADTDDDGLRDGNEDIDFDGILDATETEPKDSDTDDDGLNDGMEKGRSAAIPGGISGGPPATQIPYFGTAAGWIPDADPSSLTDPRDTDTDNDGLTDSTEDTDHDGLVDGTESNPADADTDDDGIKDGDEITFSLNKKTADTDGDGLNDGLEIGRSTSIPGGTSDYLFITYSGTSGTWVGDSNTASKTDPLDADSDNDGISDGNEDKDRDGNLDVSETNPVDADIDDDGLKDGEEDLDDDGILDAAETDPKDADTDDDGLNDGLEKGRNTAVPAGTSEGSYVVNRVAYLGTAAGWTPDADPLTVTDARDTDTDNDGLTDGTEDADHDGLVDLTESDPNNADTDNDGSSDAADCNKTDSSIYPGAVELPADGIDQNCDGAELCYKDTDDDGYRPDASSTVISSDCDCTDAYEATAADPVGDCNDAAASIHPGAVEIPADGVDQDCNGGDLCYLDADDDGYRPDASSTVMSADCDCDDAYEATAADPVGDCNDAAASIHPGAVEIPADGVDQDCNGGDLCYIDADDDGYRPDASSTVVSADCDCADTYEAVATDPVGDCDDTNSLFHPDAPEGCDEGDRNCDGKTRSSTEESITESACFSYTAPDGTVYTTPGIKVAVIPNADGCDHTITIDLTIKNVDVSVTQDLSTLTANAAPAEYQWLDCDDGNNPIAGETSQTFTAITSGNYAVKVTQDGCEDISLCYPVVATAIITENSLTRNLRVYPNPTSGQLNIDMGERIPELKIITSDVNGRIISSVIFRDRQLLNTYLEGAPGIYNIRIIAGEKEANIRVMKN